MVGTGPEPRPAGWARAERAAAPAGLEREAAPAGLARAASPPARPADEATDGRTGERVAMGDAVNAVNAEAVVGDGHAVGTVP